jgi:hypothetical protein
MNTRYFRFSVVGFLCTMWFTGLAHAGPGWDVTSFATSPANAPKLVAAIDAWMAAGGKEYPGQVTLNFNEADGNDPATHTIIATFPSVAAMEAYNNKVQSNEKMSAEWAKLMKVFSDNVTPVQTTRGNFVKNWGEIDPADSVWMHHMVTASDAAAVVAAFDRWMNSPTGKKSPAQVHLSNVVAGGMGSPSHVVSIGYASQAEAETWQESLAGNQDYQTFLAAVGQVSEYHGANLAIRVKTWGNPPAQTASR